VLRFAGVKPFQIKESREMRVLILALVAASLTGCVGTIVSKVVTAPVKVVSKTVDVMTTSQDEADRNRGRAAREAEDD
jgi:hypothetical protein